MRHGSDEPQPDGDLLHDGQVAADGAGVAAVRKAIHYYVNNESKYTFRSKLLFIPSSRFQQRLPAEVLSSLSSTLVREPQIFELIRVLGKVQQQTEKELFNDRLRIKADMDAKKRTFREKYTAEVNKATQDELPRVTMELDREQETMVERQKEALRKFDLDVIQTLDQKAIDQQKTLENSGIPGFHVTTNPTETQVQMYLLDFITRLDYNAQ